MRAIRAEKQHTAPLFKDMLIPFREWLLGGYDSEIGIASNVKLELIPEDKMIDDKQIYHIRLDIKDESERLK